MKRKMMKYWIGLGLLAMAISSCGPQKIAITTPPVDVTFTSKPAQSGIKGYEATEIRAMEKTANNSAAELTGLKCTLTGSGFSAKAITPALVNLPDYGDKSRPVLVSCTRGAETKTAFSHPYNATSEKMMNNSGNGGLLGVLIVASIDAARNKANDDWSYYPATVMFDAPAAASAAKAAPKR